MANQAKTPEDTFPVQQGVDTNYLHSILTKDITTLESVYDLIDNAIDAARDRILDEVPVGADEYGLPDNYAGYYVGLRFRDDSVSVLDNCSGIDEQTLSGKAFVTGRLSEHRFGIGRFGIGMKRALFRIGGRYALSTDTGETAAKMKFSKTDLGNTDGTPLLARRVPTRSRQKTLLYISELRTGVRHEIKSSAWTETVRKNLSRRYGLFISKGLKVSVNGTPVDAFGPGIRKHGPVSPETDHIETSDGVDVFIDSGMHQDYRLRGETDYDKAKVDALTDQYGWYFVCNDRIIKVASHEKDLGWKRNWHQEYYGFIGWVRFVSEDAGLLPWDTKKTMIDPNSPVFHQISDRLQSFAEKFKKENKQARKTGKPSSTSPATPTTPITPSTPSGQLGGGRPSGQPPTSKPPASAPGGGTKTQGQKKDDHNENWETLLPEMDVVLDSRKVRALVYEAVSLEVKNCYAGTMLLRAIVEQALSEHIKKSGNYKNVQEMVFEQQETDGRPFTEAQKKTFRPRLKDMTDWLKRRQDYFPAEVRRDCGSSLTKFVTHLKEMNGVVHEGDLIDSGKLVTMRTDTLTLLQFLLGTAPKKNG